mgnify:CR=1 FL=1
MRQAGASGRLPLKAPAGSAVIARVVRTSWGGACPCTTEVATTRTSPESARGGPYPGEPGMKVLRALDLDVLAATMKQPVFVDLRNIYRPEDVEAAGLRWHGIGRAPRP